MSRLARAHLALARIARAVDRVIEAIASTLLALVVLANGAEIVARGAFAYSFTGLYELNLLAANWMYFLGVCLVYYRNSDITIDVALQLFDTEGRRLYLILVNVVSVATMAVIAWYGVSLIQLQWPFRTTGFGIPNPLFTAPVVIGAAVIIIILAKQSLDLWFTGAVAGSRPAHETAAS